MDKPSPSFVTFLNDIPLFMREVEFIRELFRPVQPSVKSDNSLISYTEFRPSAALAPYIYCYWRLKTNGILEAPYSYRVVSDGCIDIFFQVDNTSNSFVMGFSRKYTEFDIGTSFDYIGIRFLPSFFYLFFNIDAKLLSNQDQFLSKVHPELASWIEQIDSSKNFIQQINTKLETFLPQLNIADKDQRFYHALQEILSRKGNIDLETEMVAGLSPRQLRRKFNLYIGTTPKAFANVVRFQYILNAKPSKQSLKENKIYYDVGFYDQAHFIKSFKTFYGVTPSEALS